jgi:uncharacterized membrane protein YhaH (DUF805 family)
MNIKLKAALITAAILLIIIAAVYAIVWFPAALFFAFLAGFLYFLYMGVCSYLEHEQKRVKENE